MRSTITTDRASRMNTWPARLAATWSGLAAAMGLWWLATPSAYPFGAGDPHADISLLAGTTAGQAAALLLVAGPIGIVLALATRKNRQTGLLVVAGAAVYAAGFGLLVPDLLLLILFTYLVTRLGPVSLFVLLAAGVMRSPGHMVVVVAALAVIAVSAW